MARHLRVRKKPRVPRLVKKKKVKKRGGTKATSLSQNKQKTKRGRDRSSVDWRKRGGQLHSLGTKLRVEPMKGKLRGAQFFDGESSTWQAAQGNRGRLQNSGKRETPQHHIVNGFPPIRGISHGRGISKERVRDMGWLRRRRKPLLTCTRGEEDGAPGRNGE